MDEHPGGTATAAVPAGRPGPPAGAVVVADAGRATPAVLDFALDQARRRRAPLVLRRPGSPCPAGLARVAAAARRAGVRLVLQPGLDPPPVDGAALLVVGPAEAPAYTRPGVRAPAPPLAVVPGRGCARGPVVLGLVPWTPSAAVATAVREATAGGVPLQAVRVWWAREPDPGRISGELLDRWDSLDARMHGEIERALHPHRSAHLHVQPMVVRDEAARLLAELSGGARMLVVGHPEPVPPGPRETGFVAGRFVPGLAAAVRCPMLVVPRAAGSP